MPELCMCMGMQLEQELRQELRLNQEQLMLQSLLLEGEKKYEEQRKVLEKIKQDIKQDIYSDIDNFHYRVMKRIKKKERSASVKDLIGSLRNLIDSAKVQEKEINLKDIYNTAELGLASIYMFYEPSRVFRKVTQLSEKIDNSLEDIIKIGKNTVEDTFSPSAFFNSIMLTGEIAENTQKVYNNINEILSEYGRNRKTAYEMFSEGALTLNNLDKSKVNTLFRLIRETCELVVPDSITYQSIDTQSFLAVKNLEEIVEQYSNTPLPIISILSEIKADPEILKKMDEFAGTRHVRKSRDNKRAYFSALHGLKTHPVKNKLLKDVFTKASGVRQARDILSKVAGLHKMGMELYKFDLPNGDAILEYLCKVSRKTFVNPVLNELSEEGVERFEKMLENSWPDKYHSAYLPILELGKHYSKDNPEGVKLLGRLMESLLLDKFEEFRYRGEVAERQLNCLEGRIEEWKRNKEKRRIIGDLKGLEPMYNAVIKIAENLRDNFKQAYGQELTPQLIVSLDREGSKLAEEIQVKMLKNKEVPELLKKLHDLDEKRLYVRVVNDLSKLKLEEVHKVQKIIGGTLSAHSSDEYRTGIEAITSLTYNEKFANLKIVTVKETDDPYHTINVGCTPVKSCMRWTEKTAYNDCLPAYVVDANKKLFQVIDERYNVRVRSIVRLLGPEDPKALEGIPTLFVEHPYANILSRDLCKALMGGVIEKAYRMSREIGGPISIAANDSEYKSILKKIAKKVDVDYLAGTLITTFPKGRNKCEYSDGFRGKITSGKRTESSNTGYILIEHEFE